MRFVSGVDHVPPHLYPLPKERVNLRTASSDRCPVDLVSGSVSPSPWGEGRGEGERDRRQKRTPSAGLDEKGQPLNVKGIAACAQSHRFYLTTTRTLLCFDLVSEKLLWEKAYAGGCDRLAISPDGQIIYLPSLEKEHWHVVDAIDGKVLKKIVTSSGAHNTILGPVGKFAYLA